MIQIDMDMPKSCDVCDFKEEINGKLYCGNPFGMIKGEYVDDCIMTRHEDCPLIEVEQEWISCNERMPEYDVPVLATTAWGDVTIGQRLYWSGELKGCDWFIHEGNTNADDDDIIAWLPLPEPYNGD